MSPLARQRKRIALGRSDSSRQIFELSDFKTSLHDHQADSPPTTSSSPVFRPSAVVRPSPRPVSCVKARFNTPNVGCFAFSPWEQHSICEDLSPNCPPYNVRCSSPGSNVVSVVGSKPSITTMGTREKRAGWRTADALSASNPTITRCSVEKKRGRVNL